MTVFEAATRNADAVRDMGRRPSAGSRPTGVASDMARAGPRPTLTVFAGPNGSGKSTLHSMLAPLGTFVNADDVARSLSADDPATAMAAAGRRTLAWLRELVAARVDVAYETTLSGRNALSMMARARGLGYRVDLAFVCLPDADMNVSRVAARVAAGGHDVPEVDVRRRWPRSFANLGAAMALSDQVIVYDNAGATDLVLRSGEGIDLDRLDTALPHHALVSGALARAALDRGGAAA